MYIYVYAKLEEWEPCDYEVLGHESSIVTYGPTEGYSWSLLQLNSWNIIIFHDNMKENNRIMHFMTCLQCKNGQNIGVLGEFPKGPWSCGLYIIVYEPNSNKRIQLKDWDNI